MERHDTLLKLLVFAIFTPLLELQRELQPRELQLRDTWRNVNIHTSWNQTLVQLYYRPELTRGGLGGEKPRYVEGILFIA